MQTSARSSSAVREIPGRSDAEKALATALAGERRFVSRAVVYLPDHLSEFVEEGNFELADRALLAYCQCLAGVLPPNARLYRWSATALLVVAEGSTEEGNLLIIPEAPGLGKRRLFDLGLTESLANLARELDFYVAGNI